jgi:uncharacterized protein YgiM (DUF1202 family)
MKTPFDARRALLPKAVALLAAIGMLLPAAPAFAVPSTVYTTRNVYLRAGPGVRFAILAELPGGEALTVVDQYTVWYKVSRADGTAGWVSGSYVSLDPPGSGGGGGAAPASIYAIQPGVGEVAIVTTPLLNVRTGPGVNFPVIARAAGGDLVTVLDKREQWRLVRLSSGTQGWVNSQFLSRAIGSVPALTGGTSTTAVPPFTTVITPANATPLEVDIVTTPRLNVRTGPGVLYAVVTVLNQGDFVTVLAKGRGWRYIKTAGGVRGWSSTVGLLRCDCGLP